MPCRELPLRGLPGFVRLGDDPCLAEQHVFTLGGCAVRRVAIEHRAHILGGHRSKRSRDWALERHVAFESCPSRGCQRLRDHSSRQASSFRRTMIRTPLETLR